MFYKIFVCIIISLTSSFLVADTNFQNNLSQEYILIDTLETEDCHIAFIENAHGEKFVVKQIKSSMPSEQFMLVADAVGCKMAEDMGVAMNKVVIIPAQVPFIGKKWIHLPATLHTQAEGVALDKSSYFQDLDIHQRLRKVGSVMWHKFGPQSPGQMGLRKKIMEHMASHPDLPPIVALDTFVGNADRSGPNIFYNVATNRFCGIDLAAAFNSELGLHAYNQICSCIKNRVELMNSEQWALKHYVDTLQCLINMYSPEKQIELLLSYAAYAGFVEDSELFDDHVRSRINFHKLSIRNNYAQCVYLVDAVNTYLYLCYHDNII